MATDLKTSQEAYGGSFEYGDLVRIARVPYNYALSAEAMFAESLQLSALQNKVNTSTLVVGKWYYVTDYSQVFVGNLVSPIYVQAIAVNRVDNIAYMPVVVLAQQQLWRVCSNSNFNSLSYIETQTGCRVSPSNNLVSTAFRDNSWRFRNSLFERHPLTGAVPNLNVTANQLIVIDSRIAGSTINHTATALMSIESSTIESCTLTNASNRQIYIQGSTLYNCTITFSSTAPTSTISLVNVHWRNVNVTIHGNPSGSVNVINQSVTAATSSQSTPSFTIDGQWQSRVVNSWSGHAVLDDYDGYSSVKMNLPFSASPDGTTPNWGATRVYAANNSIVGEYLLEENTGASSTTYSIAGISNLTNTKTHAVTIRPKTSVQNNTYNFTLKSSSGTMVNNYDILAYHAVGAKAGELKLPNSTLRVRYMSQGTAQFSNQFLHLLPTGAHYD